MKEKNIDLDEVSLKLLRGSAGEKELLELSLIPLQKLHIKLFNCPQSGTSKLIVKKILEKLNKQKK